MKHMVLRSPKEIWSFLTDEGDINKYPLIVLLTHIVKLITLFWVSSTLAANSIGYDSAYFISDKILVFTMIDLIFGSILVAFSIHAICPNYMASFLVGLSPTLSLVVITIAAILYGVASIFLRER